MNAEFFTLSGIPAVRYDEPAPRVLLCIHGKMEQPWPYSPYNAERKGLI